MSTEALEQMQFCNHKGICGLLNVYGCKTRQGKGNSAESRQSAFSHSRRHTVIPGRHHFQHIGGMKLCGSCGEHQEGRKLARENKRGVFCAILLSCEAAKDLYFILIQQHAPLELEHRPLPCFSSSLQTLQTRPMRKGNYQNPREEICVQCSEQWLWSCLRTTLLPRSAHTCVQHRLNKMHQSASQNRKGNSGVEHGSDQHHRCASSQRRQHLRTAVSAPRH